MKKKVSLSIIGILILMNVLLWQEIFELNKPKNLKVDFLSVGQGDSEYFQTVEGHQVLIDGGPSSAVLEKLSKRIPVWDRDLDLVILTHPERDHMQGLIEVLNSYKADYILWNGIVKESLEYNAWIKVLERQKNIGSKIITSKPGMEISLGKAKINVLYPLEDLNGQNIKNSSNDTGVIVELKYGKNSFLFTGDIDDKGEKDIIANYKELKTDVLKVAHHGSKYSTSNIFLEAVRPKIAVIEVGKNSYGHPTQETLGRLSNFGVKTLRTDQNGDITILTNGNNIQLK